MRFETLAVHAAAEPDPRTGAVTAAIQMSTTFQRAADGTFPSGFAYIRDANPNRRALEAAVATLEGGASAVAFASGMAATMAVFQALAPGEHVVAPLDAYFGTSKLLREHFVPWGLDVTFTDMTDVAAVRAALRPKPPWRSRLTGAGRPASALHRPRAPGRSHRGSSTGARRLIPALILPCSTPSAPGPSPTGGRPRP